MYNVLDMTLHADSALDMTLHPMFLTWQSTMFLTWHCIQSVYGMTVLTDRTVLLRAGEAVADPQGRAHHPADRVVGRPPRPLAQGRLPGVAPHSGEHHFVCRIWLQGDLHIPLATPLWSPSLRVFLLVPVWWRWPPFQFLCLGLGYVARQWYRILLLRNHLKRRWLPLSLEK